MRNPKLDEAHVRDLMKKLDLTREEAIRLINDDENDITIELTPEQVKVEKEMRRADRKKETAPRKRERKINQEKEHLFYAFKDVVFQMAECDCYPIETESIKTITPAREFEFIFNNNHYSVILIKHRKEKK